MKNKLILFDWGNIVESHQTGFTCYDAWNELFRRCGYKGDETIFYKLAPYKVAIITSVSDFEDTFNKLKEDFNLSVNYDEFKKIYLEVFDNIDYYVDVRDFELSLRDKCKIGILSDLTIFDKVRLDKQVGLSNYDYVFLSCEIGIKKPNKEIFEYVQSKIPFNKEDILFIDDREDNVRVAQEFGWNAFKLTGLELDKIREVVNNFLN